MAAYYSEHDKFAAAWLRELIKARLIADGEVDERDIQDVAADDVRGFAQCHFFAGIGGWSYALRLAGWPDERAVWTGSCPCQPFSSAGAQTGGHDPRDLWPAWQQLIAECRPAVLFGEQVEAAVAHGWLDRVADDLEREGYALGAACLPAASVGAFHLRNRLWFVAESERNRREGTRLHVSERESRQALSGLTGTSGDECVADAEHAERRPQREHRIDGCNGPHSGRTEAHGESGTCGEVHGLGHAGNSRLEEPRNQRRVPSQATNRDEGEAPERASAWSDVIWLSCRDGKTRATQSGLQPLAHGAAARVGRLRGYGNSIVPQVAQAFIEAYLDLEL